jgi:hypothetical protein
MCAFDLLSFAHREQYCMYSKFWNPRSYHIADQREVVNCVPLFVSVGTLRRSWETAHHHVLVHLGEISLLAHGFRKEELRSCHAGSPLTWLPCFFPLALHAKHAQTMLRDDMVDTCQGGTRCIWHVRLQPLTPRGMSHSTVGWLPLPGMGWTVREEELVTCSVLCHLTWRVTGPLPFCDIVGQN